MLSKERPSNCPYFGNKRRKGLPGHSRAILFGRSSGLPKYGLLQQRVKLVNRREVRISAAKGGEPA